MTTPAIELVNVVRRFGDFEAVKGLSLTVPRGQCLGLLGPNGAGKTTTLEMLEGLQRPTSGTVHVLGKTWETDEAWLRQRIGLALQETHFDPWLTVGETVALFRSFLEQGLEPADALRRVNLSDRANQRVEGLSGGQKQRLALAVGIIGDPEVLFLDEPTSGLDPQARRALWDIIEDLKSLGTTIVLTTHYMDEVEQLSDRIVVLDRGAVIADGTARALRQAHGGYQVVDLETDGPLSSDALAALPGVRSVTQVDHHSSLRVDGIGALLPALTQLCTAQQRALVQLSVREPSLDDVFIELTGRSLREAAAPEPTEP